MNKFGRSPATSLNRGSTVNQDVKISLTSQAELPLNNVLEKAPIKFVISKTSI